MLLQFGAQWRALLATSLANDRTFLRPLLALERCAVTVVDDGVQVLDILAEQSFDLLILERDLDAPDARGILEAYRLYLHMERPHQPAPAIIFITPTLSADVAAQEQRDLVAAGGFGLLCRPLFVNETRALLRAALASAQRAPAMQPRLQARAS